MRSDRSLMEAGSARRAGARGGARTLSLLFTLAASAVPAAFWMLAGPAPEPALRYRMRSNPPSLDPVAPPNESSGLYIFNLFDGLVEYAPDTLDVVPAVADRWTASADGTTYTFHLRDKVRFHDGRAVTSADVVFSLKRALDPRSGSSVVPLLDTIRGAGDFSSGRSKELTGVTAPDPRTVVITLERPFAPFLAALAGQAGSIMPADVYSDPNKGYLEHPVGCGPFRFVSWERGVSLRMEAFPQHWKGKPGVSKIDVRFIPSAMTALEEYKTDGIDLDNEAPSGQRAWVRENLAADYKVWPRVATSFIFFNHKAPPFKGNAKLRLAMNWAIDREHIARDLQEGKDTPASRILPPGLLGHDPSPGPFGYDPNRAKSLLAEAGYPQGKGLGEITYLTQDNEGIRRYSEAVQSDLARIGVKVRLKVLDFAAYGKAVDGTPESGADAQLFNALWYPDLPDPDGFLRVLLHTENAGSQGNYSRYSNPEVDRLLDEGRARMDPKAREAIYRKAETMALEDGAVIPLYYQRDDMLLKPRVAGLRTSPLGDFAIHLELLSIGP